MRRPTGLIVAVVAVAAVAIGGRVGPRAVAQGPDAWRNWQFSAAVEIAPVTESRLAAVLIPPAVTARAGEGWRDVRLVDEAGAEVPFMLRARTGGRVTDARDVRLLEPGFVAGRYTQVVLDLGADAIIHNGVWLGLDGTDDLQTWVEVATSADARTWQVLVERAPIFRLRQADRGARTDVSYPDSRSRYLRLRILEPARRVGLASARVTFERVTEPERVPAGIPLAATSDPARPAASVWTATGPELARRLISEVRFQAPAAPFSRRVSIEVTAPSSAWRVVRSADLGRGAPGGDARESLTVPFTETTSASWRVVVLNGSDPPVGSGFLSSSWIVPQESGRAMMGHAKAG